MGGRGVECARGKVIGGSSSINAMAYVRGHRGDYDRWAAAGLPEWSYRACAALFPPAGILGRRRQLFPRRRRPAHGAHHALRRPAGRRLRGGRRLRRLSGDRRLQRRAPGGFRPLADDGARRPALQRRGRLSAARAWRAAISPSWSTRSRRRIVLDGTRAIGVEYARRGRKAIAHADREVILCGGVINSPQLLMLSGIGDPAELAAHGIATRGAARPASARICRTTSRPAPSWARRDSGPVPPPRCGSTASCARSPRPIWRGDGMAARPAGRHHGVPQEPHATRRCPTSSSCSTPRR